jgi:hypothetical protein
MYERIRAEIHVDEEGGPFKRKRNKTACGQLKRKKFIKKKIKTWLPTMAVGCDAA